MRGAAHAIRQAGGHSLILVGHVTKEGTLAGPRVLEHIVDTVLYFEGDTHSSFRLVRAFKNRFGAVNELGVFAMTERGLRGVSNPSAMFLSQHGAGVPGRASWSRRKARGRCWSRYRRWSTAPTAIRAASPWGWMQNAPGHAARGAAPARGRRVRRSGRVRECGGRREDRRARRRTLPCCWRSCRR
jgi:hypothetical protein